MDHLTQLGQDLDYAYKTYHQAGVSWQEASVNFLKAAIKKQFPTATRAELTIILTEDFTDHDIVVYEGTKPLTIDDDLDLWSEDWWLLASEGAVFEDGERTTIYLEDV